jgi:iron complex outermembrane receptor protein
MERGIRWRARIGAAALMGVLLIAVSAWADEPPEAAPAEDAGPTRFSLEKVEHVEQRHKSLQERHDSNISKVIITREDIVQFRDRRAGDIIRRLPGLFMGGPPGENRDVRLRGLDKEYTQILVNGERISGGGQKREFELDRIPADMIERIEIIKNPSAEFNSDAVAGIVNIVLRPAASKFTVDGLIGAGGPSDAPDEKDKYIGDRNAVLNIGDRKGNWGWRLGGSAFRQLRTSDKEKLKTNQDRDVEQELVPTDSLDGFGALTWDASPSDQIRLTPFMLYREEDRTKTKDTIKPNGTISAAEKEDEFKVLREPRITLAWDHRFEFGGKLELNSTLNLHEEEKTKTKDTGTKPGGQFTATSRETEKEIKRDTEKIVNANLRLPFTLFGMKNFASTGTKIRLRNRTQDKSKFTRNLRTGVVTNTTGAKDNFELNERNFGFFAQDEIAVTDRFILTPGVRAELTDADTLDKRSGRSAEAPLTTDLTPSLHALYHVFENTNLRASIARAIRRPQFDQLIATEEITATQIKRGNPQLRPEKSWNYELQVEQFWKDGIFSLGTYYRVLEDKQEEVIIGKDGLRDIVQPMNVGNGKLWGMEAEFMRQLDFEGFHWLKDFRFRANYTWTISSEVLDPKTGANRRFKDTPTHIANVILEYLHPGTGIGMNAGVNFLSDRIDPKQGGTPKVEESLTTLDVSITKTIGKNMSLFFDTRNLTFAGKNKVDQGEGQRESIPTRFFFGLKWFY